MSVELSTLVGRTFEKVQRGQQDNNDAILFDDAFALAHYQDCCESVYIEDICGDLADLEGTPILQAEVVSHSGGEDSHTEVPSELVRENEESYTWTFFKFATIKGSVTIRFFGSSSGYYSESADLYDLSKSFRWDD